MRITKLESLHADGGWRTFSFLKLSTDEGVVGWSEYSDGFGAGGTTELIQKFAPIVVGMDPREVGRLNATLHAITKLAAGGLNAQAIAAIENACIDVKARALGVPVCQLFGGAVRERIPVYWSHCGMFRLRFPEFFEKHLGKPRIRGRDDLKCLGEEAVARGFKTIKTNPIFFDGPEPRSFNGGFRIAPGFLERNVDARIVGSVTEVLAAFRDGLGPQPGILCDLNFSQRTEGFIRIAKAAEPYNLTWLECDSLDPKALAYLRRSTSTPIASLEAIYGLAGYRPFFEEYAVDAAIIDVPWNGLYQAVRIATLADAFEVNVAPHNFNGPIGDLMSAHFCAAVPNFRIMEYEADDVPWKQELLTEPNRVENGEFILPQGPGWGAAVNEDAVRAHPPAARK